MKALCQLLVLGACAPNLVFSATAGEKLDITDGTAPALAISAVADDRVGIAKRGEEWTPSELVVIANNGCFKMIEENMDKIPDWVQKYKDWEVLALQNTATGKSLSARYGEEKLGMPHLFCDPDNGCSSLPSPLKILQFVDATNPDMPRDLRVKEAQGRYWTAMSYYMVFRTVTHTLVSLFMIAHDSLVLTSVRTRSNVLRILCCQESILSSGTSPRKATMRQFSNARSKHFLLI